MEFAYHADGQLASRSGSEGAERFWWDGLALVKRNATNYTVEPAVTGGNPVLADDEALFNDMLGTTLGSYNGKEFIDNHRTAFGAGSEKGFFTGKPCVEDLGAVFLFRNYRPSTGKWMTSEPLGYPDGWNNFAYCNNWVINRLDPLGLVDWDNVWRGAAGVLGGVGEIAGGCFAVANVETFGVTQTIGVVAVIDGFGRVALGIANITTGATDQEEVPTSYAQVAAETASEITSADPESASKIASIVDYAVGLVAPSANWHLLGDINDIITAESALSDIVDSIESLVNGIADISE